MFKTLKTIAAELKRANDLKERDIKNKETWMWYARSNTVTVEPQPYNGPVNYTHNTGMTYTTAGDPYR